MTGVGTVDLKSRYATVLRPERVFTAFGLIYGLLFLIITPPFQVPDEPEHFWRSYQISECRLTALKRSDGIGGFLPSSLMATVLPFYRLIMHPEVKQDRKEIIETLKVPLRPERRAFLHFANTALYSPVPYLPQACGIFMGRALNSPPLLIMYMGRFANMIIWMILVHVAIKTTPICKWLFVLLALMPMSLFEAASLSADSFTIGISFLTISLILKKAFAQDEGKHDVLYIGTASLLLALSKQVYFLLPLLLFLLIPVVRIGNRKKYFAFFSAMLCLNLGAIIIWTLNADIYRDIYIIYHKLIPTLSAERQTAFILSNPLEYCRKIAATFIQDGRIYFDSFIGLLGWFDTQLPEGLRISYIIMLLFTVVAGPAEAAEISFMQRILIFLTMAVSILTIITILYIGWTPVGGKIIWVQGRYFIPVAPLFFLLFYRDRPLFKLGANGAALVMIFFAFLTLNITAYEIINRYYA